MINIGDVFAYDPCGEHSYAWRFYIITNISDTGVGSVADCVFVDNEERLRSFISTIENEDINVSDSKMIGAKSLSHELDTRCGTEKTSKISSDQDRRRRDNMVLRRGT